MEGYALVVMLLRFAVDFLLLLGVCCMSGCPPEWGRLVLGALIGGLHVGVCLLPISVNLAKPVGVTCVLGLICLVAFGFRRGMLHRSILFVLLHLALNGIGVGVDKGGLWSFGASAVGVFLLCVIGIHRQPEGERLVPVELSYGSDCVRTTALRDTGNTLRDPVTGRSVLVVSAEIAEKLTGLSREQLRHPVEVMSSGAIPGLRLVPYRTIGQNSGMMLALQFHDVRIGKWRGNSLVAFAPGDLDGEYQALAGGTV